MLPLAELDEFRNWIYTEEPDRLCKELAIV